MSDASESKPLLDLTELRLMPKWVSDFSKTPSRTDADSGETETREHRGPRDRDQRGGGGGGGGYRGDQRGGPPRGDRRAGPGPGGGQGRPPGGPRPAGRSDDRRGGGGTGGGYRDRDRGSSQHHGRDDRGGRPAYDPGPQPVAGLKVHVEPDAKATEAMAAMIRTAGKAYSVFDAARLVLASGDRFHVKFTLANDNPQKLYAVPAQSSLWLSREEALTHVLEGEALSEYYRTEDVELEAPKGNFNSVAVCGMSGELLGPPSHHSYQANLHRIHRERFANMAFEDYKRRVRTDTSPEAIEKWKASQTHGRQWVVIKEEVAEGAEPTVLKSRAEMEAHFRKHYADGVVREVSEATVTGNIPKNLLAVSLYLHLRGSVEEARKHLLQTAQQLCTGFEQNGLKLFKRRGGKLWVSRTRPRTIDPGTVLSVRIAKIIEVVKNQPGIATKDLVEIIAPAAAAATPPPATVAPAPAPAPVAEASSEAPAEEPSATDEVQAAPVAAATAPSETPAHHALSDEQLLVLKDLHWLNSEGYVIEYADGIVFPGVTEPPPPKPKVVKEASAAVTTEGAADEAAAPDVAAAETQAAPVPVTETFSVAEEEPESNTETIVAADEVAAAAEQEEAPAAPVAEVPVEEASEVSDIPAVTEEVIATAADEAAVVETLQEEPAGEGRSAS